MASAIAQSEPQVAESATIIRLAEDFARGSAPDDWNPGYTAPIPASVASPFKDGDISIASGFEAERPLKVSKIGENHYSVNIEREFSSFFAMLRVQGAAGKKLRFDLKGLPAQAGWGGSNPVCANIESLSELGSFHSSAEYSLVRGGNGSVLPVAPADTWKFIPTVWRQGNSLSFEHSFDAASTYVALRVPFTNAYSENYAKSLEARGGARF